MNLKKILTHDMICVDLKANTKQGVIEELLDILMKSEKIRDRSAALQCILERERKMSTGIQFGIAIPHGKTDAVDDLVACIGVSRDGIDFDALDQIPSRLFIMTISPIDKTGPHVQFLSDVSRLLKDEENRDAIINAKTAEEVIALIG